LLQEFERSKLLMATGFSNRAREALEFIADVLRFQEFNSAGQNGGFDHRVFGSVESEEIAQSAVIHDLGDNLRTLLPVVDG
jgi:hypothetical protein